MVEDEQAMMSHCHCRKNIIALSDHTIPSVNDWFLFVISVSLVSYYTAKTSAMLDRWGLYLQAAIGCSSIVVQLYLPSFANPAYGFSMVLVEIAAFKFGGGWGACPVEHARTIV